ncbi:hypothetical protein Sango_2088100 [Sesamum angolense]|uniref:CCHC-type domain-containing protein n=1 Tax=Sesamum angolense TaxID=2727404 RepID=A0AAE1WBI4_9LAMI|nr:hypothetical protein Sango_2088100 [Sesamum angolense]
MDLDQNGFDPSKPFIHNNMVRKLPLPNCDLTSRGTIEIEENCTIVVNEEACSPFPCLTSHGGRHLRCNLVGGSGLTPSNMIHFESEGSCDEICRKKSILRDQDDEGSSVQSHGVKMLSLVEKLEDLKAGLDNNTYIDMTLHSLPPSYDPFIINYNMNRLEKYIHELINMLVQYKATTHKSAVVVLVGEATTSKAKGKKAECWKRKKEKGKVTTTTASAEGAPAVASGKGKGKGKVGGSQWSKANDVCMHCQGRGHYKRECPQLLSNLDVGKKQKTKKNDQEALCWTKRARQQPVEFDPYRCLWTIKYSGKRRILIVHNLHDDHSWYGYVYLMRYKSEAFGRLKEYILEVENQTGHKIQTLRSDRGYALETAAKLLNMAPSKKGFPMDNRQDGVLLEESSKPPQQNDTTSFEPSVPTDGVLVLRRSTKESRPPERSSEKDLSNVLHPFEATCNIHFNASFVIDALIASISSSPEHLLVGELRKYSFVIPPLLANCLFQQTAAAADPMKYLVQLEHAEICSTCCRQPLLVVQLQEGMLGWRWCGNSYFLSLDGLVEGNVDRIIQST